MALLADRLVGTHRLVSLETRRSDGAVSHPMGPHPQGLFMFDRAGNFSVQLMNTDRVAGGGGGPAPGYGALWGRYEVDEAQQTFTLIPEGSLQPGLIGTRTVRHVNFGDGIAIFNTTPQVVDGVETVTYITWKPVSPP